MLQAENLSISYQGHVIFEDATFTIQPGERCGLVGRNGSGKTTLFRLLTGQESPDRGTISKPKNAKLGALTQHIHFKEPTILSEACLALPPEDGMSFHKAEKILFGLGFTEEEMEKSPQNLSGGFQLRLHLAKVLISEPHCLLLDEPTNYLDILSIRWLTRFLKQWRGEFILISHDREFMDSVTTHTMGIHRGKIEKVKGDTVAFYEQLLQKEEIHERTRQKIEKKRAHAQSFIDRFGAKASKAAQAQSRQKLLQRIPTLEKLKEIYHLDFQFKEAPFAAKKMLEAHHLLFSYTSASPLIENFSLAIEKGERIAIIGKNGRGKSTLLRLIAQDLAPQAGTLKISEHARIGYFGQTHIDRLKSGHTVEQEIASANHRLNLTEVKSICGLMMFGGALAEKPTSILSGGEKSRVLLGKILATPCNLLLLDEPTHHLDMESIEALIDALEEFEGAVVIVTHSELILKRLPLDKIVVCRQGQQQLFLGNYPEFLESQGWEEEAEARPKKKTSQPLRSSPPVADKGKAPKSLKSLDQAIAKAEKNLTQLETEQQKEQQQLISLSQAGNSLALQELSLAFHNRQKKIDLCYEELQLLFAERDTLVS